nr:unnamed protein product [Callosobruchus analis]
MYKQHQLFDSLNNPLIRIYLEFLEYVLPIFSDLNLEFQSESPKIYILYERMATTYKTILQCYMKLDYVNNTDVSEIQYRDPDHEKSEYLEDEYIYRREFEDDYFLLGGKAESLINDYDNAVMKESDSHCNAGSGNSGHSVKQRKPLTNVRLPTIELPKFSDVLTFVSSDKDSLITIRYIYMRLCETTIEKYNFNKVYYLIDEAKSKAYSILASKLEASVSDVRKEKKENIHFQTDGPHILVSKTGKLKLRRTTKNWLFAKYSYSKRYSRSQGFFNKSEKHIFNSQKISTNKKIDEYTSKISSSIKSAESILCGFLAANNLSFKLTDLLSEVVKKIFSDSQIAQGLHLHRIKATAVVTDCLGKYFFDELNEKLKRPGCLFSLIMDETTDISTRKQCAVTVFFLTI